MGVKRFLADNATEALKMAKAYAGAKGRIIGARQTPAGHEVVAEATAAHLPLDTALLAEELSEVRALVEAHLLGKPEVVDRTPNITAALKHLLEVGFSSRLSVDLATDIPPGDTLSAKDLKQLETQVANRLSALPPKSMFSHGGAFAFIGPTGVGKTTVTAKIAARCSMQYGRDQIALVAMDTFRAGAHDQLKIYADIIGVPVVIARHQEDLQHILSELAYKKIILIDTAGTSPRDVQMLNQLEALNPTSRVIKRILVLSSTTNLHTLEDVISLHSEALAGQHQTISAAILTKIDEAAQLAPAVDCLIRHNLPILLVSQGQRVPEDLAEADVNRLSYRCLNPRPLGELAGIEDVDADLSNLNNEW